MYQATEQDMIDLIKLMRVKDLDKIAQEKQKLVNKISKL